MSFHGISVEQIKSKSKYLITPKISTLCLLYQIGLIDFDKCINDKKYIDDFSVYDVIKSLKI
jgi:hypothetical protein